jgi:hypothetical protein
LIGRLWRGETSAEAADAYEELLRGTIFPGIRRIAGARGAYLLRRDGETGVEFVTLTLFDSMDSVRAFAGEDVTAAVIEPEARRLLTRFDERAVHYEVVVEPS